MPLILIYPAAADDYFKKYYVCYRILKKLQNINNNWAEKHRNQEITPTEWNEFLKKWYEPRKELTLSEIRRIKQIAYNHNWNINLDEIFIEG